MPIDFENGTHKPGPVVLSPDMLTKHRSVEIMEPGESLYVPSNLLWMHPEDLTLHLDVTQRAYTYEELENDEVTPLEIARIIAFRGEYVADVAHIAEYIEGGGEPIEFARFPKRALNLLMQHSVDITEFIRTREQLNQFNEMLAEEYGAWAMVPQLNVSNPNQLPPL